MPVTCIAGDEDLVFSRVCMVNDGEAVSSDNQSFDGLKGKVVVISPGKI